MAGKDKAEGSADPGDLVFLIGFMGSGKTTVGEALAARLGRPFFDLDRMIESRSGLTIPEIFARSGEQGFRSLEREALESCRELEGAVLALGGGAFVAAENRALLRGLGKTVWLDCPFEVCLSRIAGDASRPLLRGEAEMRSLMESRRPFYAMADIVVRTGDRPAELVAADVHGLLTGPREGG